MEKPKMGTVEEGHVILFALAAALIRQPGLDVQKLQSDFQDFANLQERIAGRTLGPLHQAMQTLLHSGVQLQSAPPGVADILDTKISEALKAGPVSSPPPSK